MPQLSLSGLTKACIFLVSSTAILTAQPQRQPARHSELASPSIPADPHELVTGDVQTPATPEDRVAVRLLMRRAVANGISHQPDMDPFDFKVSFVASGKAGGTGELSETWSSGQRWRVTESIGDYSFVRIGIAGKIADQKTVSTIPMRAQALRNEVTWRMSTDVENLGRTEFRTAAAQWNGKPVTCILISRNMSAVPARGRDWQDAEYCIANDSGLLQIHSIVPGTYSVFGYAKNIQFHGKSIPDHITTFVAGQQVVEGDVTVTDPTPAATSSLVHTPEMLANGRPSVTLNHGMMAPINIPVGSRNTVDNVIVHAQLDAQGNIVDSEISAASDPSLAEAALAVVKKLRFGPSGSTQAYFTVRFIPIPQN